MQAGLSACFCLCSLLFNCMDTAKQGQCETRGRGVRTPLDRSCSHVPLAKSRQCSLLVCLLVVLRLGR